VDVVVCGVDCAVEDDAVFAIVDGVFIDLACILFEDFSATVDAVGAVDDAVLEDNVSFAVGVDTFGTVGDGIAPDGVIVGATFVEDLDAYAAAANGVLVDVVEVCTPEMDAAGIRIYDCVLVELIVMSWFGDGNCVSAVAEVILEDLVVVRIHHDVCFCKCVAEYRGI